MICNQNSLLKALMSSIYDASVIRAALTHVNWDLFNVNVYMFLVQDENRERN